MITNGKPVFMMTFYMMAFYLQRVMMMAEQNSERENSTYIVLLLYGAV